MDVCVHVHTKFCDLPQFAVLDTCTFYIKIELWYYTFVNYSVIHTTPLKDYIHIHTHSLTLTRTQSVRLART